MTKLPNCLSSSYGRTFGGLIYLPSCIGDVCWSAAVLSALGSTLQVMLGVNQTLTIVFSACIAVLYTLAGGMYSVAYTDIIQLAFIFGGLWLAVPFILASDSVDVGTLNTKEWLGNVNGGYILYF